MRYRSLCCLQVHRVLLADSGTLLICLTDTDGHLSQLRQQLRSTFPGAPDRQTQIVHISVLRLLTAQQLDTEQRQQLQAVCDDFTSKLKGKKVAAQRLWYLRPPVHRQSSSCVQTNYV